MRVRAKVTFLLEGLNTLQRGSETEVSAREGADLISRGLVEEVAAGEAKTARTQKKEA